VLASCYFALVLKAALWKQTVLSCADSSPVCTTNLQPAQCWQLSLVQER
jgi:hypothetical protein